MHMHSRVLTSITVVIASMFFASVATALPLSNLGKGLLNAQTDDALALSSESDLNGLIHKAGYGLRIGYSHYYYPRRYGYRRYGYSPSYRYGYRNRYYRPHKYNRYRYKRRYKRRRALRRLRRLLRHRLYY